MDFTYSERQVYWRDRVRAFMAMHVVPAQARYHAELAEGPTRWRVLPVIEDLKARAQADGLWNLFLPPS
ncbi:MAG: acyl-CoA dehydrogenase, partial [Sphingobium sp.]